MNEQLSIELRNDPKQELIPITDIREGIEYVTKWSLYAKALKEINADLETQNKAAERKIRGQRHVGQMIIEGQAKGEIAKKGENQANLIVQHDKVKKTLPEMGISPDESSNWQRIATLPEEIFEWKIAENKEKELTTSAILKAAKQYQRTQTIQQQIKDIEEGNLPEIEGLFDVIVIDPPWQYATEYDPLTRRGTCPYPEMSLEEIMNIKLPVKDDGILFLWTTHQFLPFSFDILKHWGFEYKATMVWDKELMGLGYWLRMQCEFCLLAIKGSPLWINTDERDIIRETRREHSRKPEAFYKIIEKITYGRKLDYFSRELREGWASYGTIGRQ